MEVLRWYWRSWKRKIWKIHLNVFGAVTFFAALIIYDGRPSSFGEWMSITGIGLIPLVYFVIYPQLRFKPSVRTLVVSSSGIETEIERKNVNIPWGDVAAIENECDYIFIERSNGNAFIVPTRAFSSVANRSEFFDFIQNAHRSTNAASR
jgi:hypothetical protein